MTQIGTFMKTKTGFSGRIRTLALDVELTIRPAEKSDAENAPDYRIFAAADLEVGAAWSRSGEKAGDYLSINIDDPTFTQPLRNHTWPPHRSGLAVQNCRACFCSDIPIVSMH